MKFVRRPTTSNSCCIQPLHSPTTKHTATWVNLNIQHIWRLILGKQKLVGSKIQAASKIVITLKKNLCHYVPSVAPRVCNQRRIVGYCLPPDTINGRALGVFIKSRRAIATPSSNDLRYIAESSGSSWR